MASISKNNWVEYSWLSSFFFIFVIIGTISHEWGHFLVAKYFGISAHINYAYTFCDSNDVSEKNQFLFILGGPLMTYLISLVGLVLLMTKKKRYLNKESLDILDMIPIFLSLFALRPTVNLIVWLGNYLVFHKTRMSSDEIQIALYLGWNYLSISIFCALLGLVVFGVVFYRFIPSKQQFRFLVLGFLGGLSGYLFWLVYFGKIIMP